MKPLNTYLFKLSAFFLLLLTLQSCKPPKPGTYKNDEIKSGQRSDFHSLSDQIFIPIKANDIKAAKLFMAKELIDDPGVERMVEHVSNRLADNKYSLMDEYYIVNKKDNDTIRIKTAGMNPGKIKYGAVTKETYVAFYIPKTADNKYLITMVFGKYSYGWKLSALDVEAYAIGGKTAPELYQLAKQQYDKKYLVNSVINMNSASTCLRPSIIWTYDDEDAIATFTGRVIDEANKLPFPYTFSSLPMRPQLQSISNEDTDNGSYPLVRYMTHVDIADTNAVKKENVLIKKELYKMFKGLDKDNKYIYYEAFNKFPRSTESVERFKMIDKLN